MFGDVCIARSEERRFTQISIIRQKMHPTSPLRWSTKKKERKKAVQRYSFSCLKEDVIVAIWPIDWVENKMVSANGVALLGLNKTLQVLVKWRCCYTCHPHDGWPPERVEKQEGHWHYVPVSSCDDTLVFDKVIPVIWMRVSARVGKGCCIKQRHAHFKKREREWREKVRKAKRNGR